MIHHWFTTRQTNPTPDYQQNEQRQQALYNQLVLRVDKTLTAKQRAYLLHELAAWRRDFVELSAK